MVNLGSFSPYGEMCMCVFVCVYWLSTRHLYSYAWIAITEYLKLGGFNKKNLLFHSSGGWNPQIREPAGLVSSEVSPGLQTVPPHCVLTCSFLCFACTPGVLSQLDWSPTLMTSFNLKYLLQCPISKYSPIGGQSFNLGILCGWHTIQSITTLFNSL